MFTIVVVFHCGCDTFLIGIDAEACIWVLVVVAVRVEFVVDVDDMAGVHIVVVVVDVG